MISGKLKLSYSTCDSIEHFRLVDSLLLRVENNVMVLLSVNSSVRALLMAKTAEVLLIDDVSAEVMLRPED